MDKTSSPIETRLLTALLVCITAAACTSSTTSPTTTSTTTSTTSTTTTTTTSTTLPPNVTAVSPAIGLNEGGNTVTITGTSFTNTSAVLFGGVNAASFTVVSDTSIKAVSPPSTMPDPNLVDITVTTDQGTSVTAPADHFIYTHNILNRFSLSDSSVRGGAPVLGTVAVQYAAPLGGYALPVTWSSAPANSTAAVVPSSMRIDPGFVTGSFTIQTSPVTSQQCFLIGVAFPLTGAAANAAFCVVP